MAEQVTEDLRQFVEVPWEVADAALCGFGADMGGSLAKLVYISKANWREKKDRVEGSKCQLNFWRTETQDDAIDKLLQFIQDNVHVNRPAGGTDVLAYGCGLGCSLFSGRYRNDLGVKMQTINEFDCFANGLKYLIKTLPRSAVLETPIAECFPDVARYFTLLLKQTEQVSDETMRAYFKDCDVASENRKFNFPSASYGDPDQPMAQDMQYPYLLMMIGSGYGMTVFQSDGTYKTVDGLPIAGRSFLGLGSLLTGAKTWDELLDLAEQGDFHTVDLCYGDCYDMFQKFKDGRDPEIQDFYSSYMTDRDPALDRTIFCFAKAAGKSIADFKREDLAMALLQMLIINIVYFTQVACAQHGIKNVFVCGGFLQRPLVTKMLTAEWTRKDYFIKIMLSGKDETTLLPLYFLKNGGMLGAFGSFLNHYEQFQKIDQQKAKEETSTS